MLRRHLLHLRYLLRHKWYVFLECRRLRVPLWIALLHDWDKFLPDVWFAYARLNHPPANANQDRLRDAFVQAKMIHQHRNKHHWQFWVFITDCGEIKCLPIPDVYRRELLADWRGAGKSMGKPDLLGWYTECRETMRFHPETRAWLEAQLGYLA
ncbi:MAG TPA: DUF5662 family protein [Spirillospora sp.]|nr:DUF5662 family protein [Spirillospora sp.]